MPAPRLLPAILFSLGLLSATALLAQTGSQAGADPASSATLSAATSTVQQPVNIVVFSDFGCPYSANLFFTLERLEQKHPKDLHLLYKQSPLPTHPGAELAHRAALAAQRQGHFNEMAELLFSNQPRQDRDSILLYARLLHLDLARFRRDLDSPEIAAALQTDLDESHAFGVDQTPTIFLNGKSLVGTQSESDLAALIENQPAPPLPGIPDSAPMAPALVAQLEALPLAEEGAPNAPLTIVEFTDFQCPYCQQAVKPMEQFMAARGREVRWVFRAFPLDFHPDSEPAAEAALAAGEQGKFWPMHDLLFAHQTALKPADLRLYAAQLNLDLRLFDQALATHKFAAQIAADRALGSRAGVEATPTFIINGRSMAGVRSLPELNQLADTFAKPPSGSATATGSVASAVPVAAPVLPDQQVLGPRATTPLTITWYADVRSPLAARQAELLRSLESRYQRKLSIVFRAFPLGQRPDGRLGSAALLAAIRFGRPNPADAADTVATGSIRNEAFWRLFDALADRRDTLDRDKILALAQSIDLNPEAFAAALDSALTELNLNIADANRRGILGAPVMFLNEVRIDGLQTASQYVSVLDRQLAQGATVQARNSQDTPQDRP